MNKITEQFTPPFIYDPEGILVTDHNGHIMLEIRGWSWLGSEEKQDSFGNWVALALTKEAEKERSGETLPDVKRECVRFAEWLRTF